MSLKKNILGNGIANVAQKLVRVLDQLLLVPFFISAWGAAYYGEWLTLTIIPSVLAFSDLGFGSAAASSFTLKYASGDKKAAADISKTGFYIISYVIAGGMVVGAIGLLVVKYCGLLSNSLIDETDALYAVIFMLLARLLSFYNQLFEGYYRAARKAALGTSLTVVQNLLNIGAGLTVLLMHRGVVAFALSQFIAAIVFRIYYRWKAVNVLGLNKEYTGEYVKHYAKDMFVKGLGYLMSPMWQIILFQGTTFVVRVTLGPTAVAVFNTVRTVSRSVNQLYSIVNSSVFPEIQYEIGSGNMKKAQNIFVYSIWVSWLLGMAGALFLSIFGLYFYNIWTHKALNPPTDMWYLFLVGILFNAVWWTSSVIFRAMNRPMRFSLAGVVAAVFSVICSYVFCKYFGWGLTGAGWGSLIFEFIMMLYTLPVSCMLMNITIADLFKNMIHSFKQIYSKLTGKIKRTI